MRGTSSLLPSSIVLAALVSGCGGKATRAQCTEMLDKYLDMTIAQDQELSKLAPAEAKAAREIKRALRKDEPSYKRVQDQCEREITKREYRCAMKTHTPETWQACID